MIEIIRPGALASVQDLGRTGFRRIGVGSCGAMDTLAVAVGNRLLGNAPECAAIEFTLGRAAVRFHADMRVALAGAECGATLDGTPVWSWHAFDVHAGEILVLPPARGGTHAYLCVAGGIDVEPVMGSRSTDLKAAFGGLDGRALQEGDRLPVGRAGLPADGDWIGVQAPAWALPADLDGKATAVRMLPGPEYEDFEKESQQALWQSDWIVTPNSNRMGLRLNGPALARRAERSADLLSHGVVPGVMQVPPAGQPIALMADAQTTGGYPKIGVVIGADLWRLAQVPLGAAVRFVPVTLAQAAAAQTELDRYLRQIDQALQWQGDGMAIAARRRTLTRAAA
ncbi:biotin-dependent carboxyltransferase family protein [Cupriavidus consociatus]|uniref:5-oxoprolinase subunit C family protein n=1 Tax=Cupriavidus consociatus TaxID=2821357 RepID=UPI001AE6DDE3|nr:biotin-dependent carboxyltransferase family protein [Cupriavidus sp. LEh21]MBP0622056.1 biotin-dependent carboxyltransferase family protein [Cupriavidus sp. LEh25]MDK2658732.1 biotin-dependent carboxyltransferase family protein [Cupriavidus sp. LEh21]